MKRLTTTVIREVRAQVARKQCVILLDFDGVLAPIVGDPRAARMTTTTVKALTACAQRVPIGIVSGRALDDLRARTGVRSIAYAGSHGMEWYIDGSHGARVRRTRNADAFHRARRALCALAHEYAGVVVEEKYACLAICYRALTPTQQRTFRRRARRVAADHATLRVLDNNGTFELLAGCTKGDSVQRMLRALARAETLPVYVGDSLTDEDAFRALPHGITIRVGRSVRSNAKFYVRRRADVDALLRAIAA